MTETNIEKIRDRKIKIKRTNGNVMIIIQMNMTIMEVVKVISKYI